MEPYFVEGKYLTRKGAKKAQETGKVAQTDIQPFAKRFYANNPQEALQMAEEGLQGGQWIEGPKVSQQTEEQYMRAMGAPELPGFGKPAIKPRAMGRKK
jgi:hypothetical protein